VYTEDELNCIVMHTISEIMKSHTQGSKNVILHKEYHTLGYKENIQITPQHNKQRKR